MLPTPNAKALRDITRGDYEDNNEVDTACADRLLLLCLDHGKDGKEAADLMRMALRKIEVYTNA